MGQGVKKITFCKYIYLQKAIFVILSTFLTRNVGRKGQESRSKSVYVD